MACDGEHRDAEKYHADRAGVALAHINPVENVWRYIGQNWISNRVFAGYETVIDAICEAWNRLVGAPNVIKSIGSRQWAHVSRCT